MRFKNPSVLPFLGILLVATLLAACNPSPVRETVPISPAIESATQNQEIKPDAPLDAQAKAINDAELDAIQTAMWAMMADQRIRSLSPLLAPAIATNDWSALPTGASVTPLINYLVVDATEYYYCYDTTGTIASQYEGPNPCPATIILEPQQKWSHKKPSDLTTSVIASASTTGNNAVISRLTIRVASGNAKPFDMEVGNTIIKYSDKNQVVNLDTPGEFTAAGIGAHDGDSLLEQGEVFEITIPSLETGGANALSVQLGADQTFTLEVIPPKGRVLFIQRQTPLTLKTSNHLD